MMIPKSPWENLVRYVRSHLGFLLAVIVIFGGVVIAVLYADVPIIAKYIVLGVFVLGIIAVTTWVIIRTPKTPHGLVATEEYYALQLFLEHSKAYGTESQVETRQEILRKKGLARDTTLPPSKQPKQLNEGKQ